MRLVSDFEVSRDHTEGAMWIADRHYDHSGRTLAPLFGMDAKGDLVTAACLSIFARIFKATHPAVILRLSTAFQRLM